MAADNRHLRLATRELPLREHDALTEVQAVGNLQRVERLAEKVDKALTATSQGEFFTASRSSNTARDHQLPAMFALRTEIQDLKAAVEKAKCSKTEQDEQESKRLPKPNASMVAAIQNLVAEQVEKDTRDLRIKNERLEERVQKVEAENKLLRESFISAGSTTKKRHQSDPQKEGALHKAKQKIEGLAVEVDTLRKDMAVVVDTLRKDMAVEMGTLRKDMAVEMDTLRKDMADLDRTKANTTACNALRARVDELETYLGDDYGWAS